MAIGLDFTTNKSDFVISSGQVEFLTGKDRNRQNFLKMLKTEVGNSSQIEDTDSRYNPLYGVDSDQFYGKTKSIQEAVSRVQETVQLACDRYIANQKLYIEFHEEDEIFAKMVVQAFAVSSIKVGFVVYIWTAQDIRLNRKPEFTSKFVTEVG